MRGPRPRSRTLLPIDANALVHARCKAATPIPKPSLKLKPYLSPLIPSTLASKSTP
jgi:hypothetical protein